ncbi:MAG TPA: D-2-hydroxyacid dehydrogenase, partial [Burkholderiales bacterium]|nr:D-2-hydroxyacid dehydrogenase [Burkholderiales bacterium]
ELLMQKPVCVVWVNEAKACEQELARTGLTDRLEVHVVKIDQSIPEDLASRAEILLAQRPGGYLKGMPKLRWIQATTSGVDYWLSSPDLPEDVTLSCARGAHRISMAENILGAIFHITKPYMQIALDQRESRWTRRQSVTLAGKTLAILGLGAIGHELARKAAALEMRVIGTKRTPAAVPHVERVYAQEETDEVLSAAAFVVLLLPSTRETENFINANRLRAMKPTAWLFNFGRGALINDADLIAAVQAKIIAGAVLDVFRKEPLPTEHPFWNTEGIRVLPHLGGGHPERSKAMAALFADNARRYLAREPLSTEVDRTRGY